MTDLRQWPDADALLDEALGLPEAERAAFIRQRTGHDPALGAALEAVLAEAAAGDRFLAPGGALGGALFEDYRQAEEGGRAEPELAEGSTIGPYRVVRRIGRGGMGEVFRARDTRLSRDVALKILPAEFARDPMRLARFEREARVLASLSHPRIGAIYALEEGADRTLKALVLELVEGPTLAERIARGPMRVAEALTVGRELADALDAAHRRGIIHRDLKPANLKLAADGVKVLDFGLAKALQPDPDQDDGVELSAAHHGVVPVMGTAAYMSPEQARGEAVDRRADIWAFGCVLYEMLAGERAFPGETTTDVLAGVLGREPDFGRLPDTTPQPLRRLLYRCLRKDAQRRLSDIADARLELEDAVEEAGGDGGGDDRTVERSRPHPALLALAAGLAGAVVAGGVVWSLIPAPPVEVMHVSIPLPGTDEIVTGQLPVVSVTPDGRTVVYRARRDGVMQFYRRPLDRREPEAIAGTSGATGVFMSPDGEWIGFNDLGGTLMRVPIGGGQPVRIAGAPGGVSASWAADGTVVFGGGTARVLFRVPAAGGTPEAITTLDEGRGDLLHTFPDVLPGGRDVLFTIVSREGSDVAVTTMDGGGPVTVLTGGKQPRYLSSGHLVFVREGTLWAAPYDAARRTLRGPPAPVLQGIDEGSGASAAHYDVAAAGALVYLPPRVATAARMLVWVDRNGREETLPLEPREYSRATLSPDGRRIALTIADPDNQDIWIHDLDRATLTRLTSEPGIDTAPVWSPDGRFVAFRSDRDGGGLFLAPADGASRPVRLTRADGPIHTPYSFTPDGRQLLFSEFRSYRDQRIGVVPADGGEMAWLVDGGFAEIRPQVSPDGRWLAYQSDESGGFEVYVRPFPDVASRRWQVSNGGGVSPNWGPDGRELFFLSDGVLMRVAVGGGPAFGRPEPVTTMEPLAERLGPTFDVTPDGRRFLIVRAGASRSDPGTRTVLYSDHWLEEVRRVVPARP